MHDNLESKRVCGTETRLATKYVPAMGMVKFVGWYYTENVGLCWFALKDHEEESERNLRATRTI